MKNATHRQTTKAIALAITLGLLGHWQLAQAADGDLDTTFGTGGTVTTDFNGASEDNLSRIAIQPDGKIVAIGTTTIAGSSTHKYALARYNPDGTLDATFGTGGKVTTVIANVLENANALALLPDGKILIGGSIAQPSVVDSSFALLRYNSDGSLDTTFGNGGLVKTNVGTYLDSIGTIVLQPDGKIVAAGNEAFARPPGEQRNSDIAVVRYNPDGTLDPTFGNGGITTSDFGPVPGYFADDACAIILQPDGRIIVAGDSDGGGYFDFLVARYNSNGTLDATFGNGGFTKTDVGNGFEDGASDAILQPDGKIILAGAANRSNAANYDFAMLRYNTNGTLDSTFGAGGQVVFVLDNLADEELTSVLLQSDGKIVALGDSNRGSRSGFLLFRFNADGSSDTAFGSGGYVRTPFGTNVVQTENLVMQADGKIVAGGYSPWYQNADFALVRYLDGDALRLTSAASRVTQSPVPFDINLPLTGTPGVECREAGGNYTLVFTINGNVVSGNATVTGGKAVNTSGTPRFSSNSMMVDLAGVADTQRLTLMLSNVTDDLGRVMPNVSVNLNILVGDTDGNNVVNASDISRVKSQSGLPITSANFRQDVNANGLINAADLALVKAKSGHSVP